MCRRVSGPTGSIGIFVIVILALGTILACFWQSMVIEVGMILNQKSKNDRRAYHRAYYRLHRAKAVKSKVEVPVGILQGSRKAAFDLLKQYEKGSLFKQTNSYSEPLPNSRPLLQAAKVAPVQSKVKFGEEFRQYEELKKYLEQRRRKC